MDDVWDDFLDWLFPKNWTFEVFKVVFPVTSTWDFNVIRGGNEGPMLPVG
jgi:hypothetical protein